MIVFVVSIKLDSVLVFKLLQFSLKGYIFILFANFVEFPPGTGNCLCIQRFLVFASSDNFTVLISLCHYFPRIHSLFKILNLKGQTLKCSILMEKKIFICMLPLLLISNCLHNHLSTAISMTIVFSSELESGMQVLVPCMHQKLFCAITFRVIAMVLCFSWYAILFMTAVLGWMFAVWCNPLWLQLFHLWNQLTFDLTMASTLWPDYHPW